MLIQCLHYKEYSPDLFSFMSDSRLILGEFQCIILSLFHHNIFGANLVKSKTVCRSENIHGAKIGLYPVYFRGKASKLVSKRCKIIWDTLSNRKTEKKGLAPNVREPEGSKIFYYKVFTGLYFAINHRNKNVHHTIMYPYNIYISYIS